MATRKSVLLRVKDLWVEYPGGVVANRGVSMEVHAGETLGLLGENGSGKTTLAKAIAGIVKPKRGSIELLGEKLEARGYVDALKRGIALVPQHPSVFDSLTVREDVGLTLKMIGARVGKRDLETAIEAIASDLGFRLDPDRRVSSLSMGEKQKVDIVRSLITRPRLLILDEATTHLSPREFERLMVRVRAYLEKESGIIVITHKLGEAVNYSDRIVVLRKGRVSGTVNVKSNGDPVSLEKTLLSLMFSDGLHLREPFRAEKTRRVASGEPIVLEVKDLWAKNDAGGWALRGLSFKVRLGEVLGIAGIAGNGQKELFEVIAGLRKPVKGSVIVNGVNVTGKASRHVIRLGAALIPEERLGWALVPGKDLVFNAAFALQPGGLLFYRRSQAEELARRIVAMGQVKAPSIKAPIESLSGGNMQRFIVARELLREPILIVAMNPTSGLDVASASKVERELRKYAEERHAGILLISEDIDEVTMLSDKIFVMEKGAFKNKSALAPNVEAVSSLLSG